MSIAFSFHFIVVVVAFVLELLIDICESRENQNIYKMHERKKEISLVFVSLHLI